MGNEHSTATGSSRCDGVPFVAWRTPSGSTTASPRIPNDRVRITSAASPASASVSSSASSSAPSSSSPPRLPPRQSSSLLSPSSLANGAFFDWNSPSVSRHFAEPSSFQYNKAPRVTTALGVFTKPPKADTVITNKSELLGNIAIVERGGRVHFPDIVRRVLAAGAVGIVFIERVDDHKATTQALFDGFHSSGRQSVAVPIVRLSKYHADQLLADHPTRLSIEILTGDAAIKHIVPDDVAVAVATAARAGDVDLLKHLLFADPTGSLLERIPKAVAVCDAAENGHVDCLEVLHGFGVSLDEQKPNGTTALMMACAVGNVEAARALLMFGATLDLEDVHGMTALMVAARDGKVPCLKLLIRKGARINLSRNRNRGTTALHIAARSGMDECVTILLDAGAALDIQSPNSTTALMEAARAGNVGCVKLLVDAGASLTCKDREGSTAESLARTSGFTDIEDFLREMAESASVKDHRRQIEETVAQPKATLADLLSLADANDISVDVLKREMIRDSKSSAWLEQPRIIYDVFRLLTLPVASSSTSATTTNDDPSYGKYKVQHFCCELSLWYTRKIFQKHYHPGGVGWSIAMHQTDEVDYEKASGYFKVLFNFVCSSTQLDDVLLVLFCKVLNRFILTEQLGGVLWRFFATDGKFIVPWLVCHIGLDSIRDTVVWLLYADLSVIGQQHVRQSGIFECLFARLYSWQRTLSWGVGTSYQRDSIENICALINYIIYPPSVYVMSNVATFVENTDHSLPLITDQYFPTQHNELLKSLLLFLLHSNDFSFETMLDLGFSEIYRQTTQDCRALVIHEGGALSIVMMIMSTLGYHKRKRDLTGIELLLKGVYGALLAALTPRVEKFVRLARAVVMADVSALRSMTAASERANVTAVKAKGSALLYIVTFLKRCVFLQSGQLDDLLAQFGLMPSFLACFGSHPNNSLLHHELTDVIRFVLMDPDQKRLPSCRLLNGLFIERASILDFVIQAYDARVQYKGHMTTIANSIFTLTNTPNFKSSSVAITCQEVVRQYTNQHEKWRKFETTLADQNVIEMRPLGQRHAPLCDGCLKLKEHAVEYVTSTFAGTDVRVTGYLETIFSGGAHHYCKVNYTDDFITGFLYKKDKIHDHIPIPEPTRVSSFIQFPVPMPFHALTFTVTLVGLCLKCDKLWYCDTLQSPNWTTRMKWVIPTSARKWYSFGVTEGPGSGAHGIQFSTKGYKNFIVLCDTWGRQEQWMRAIDEAILGLTSQAARRIDPANAMAIEIDNEVDTDEFDLSYMHAAAAESSSGDANDNAAVPPAVKSEGHQHQRGGRAAAAAKKHSSDNHSDDGTRRRSNTISTSFSEIERLHREFAKEQDARGGSNDKNDKSSKDKSKTKRNESPTRVRSTTSDDDTSANSKGKTIDTDAASRASKADPLARSPAGASPPRHNGTTSSAAAADAAKRKLDLKKFQPDTRKFDEILNNLKIVSPPRMSVTINSRGAAALAGGGLPRAGRRTIPPAPPASSDAKFPTMLVSKDSSPAIITRQPSAEEVAAAGDNAMLISTASSSSLPDGPVAILNGRKQSLFSGMPFTGANAIGVNSAAQECNPLEPLGLRHVVSTPNLTQLT